MRHSSMENDSSPFPLSLYGLDFVISFRPAKGNLLDTGPTCSSNNSKFQ